MSIINSQSNLVKGNNDEKRVRKIKKVSSKDVTKQEKPNSTNIKSEEKLILKVPSIKKHDSISVAKKINKVDKTLRVSTSKDSINKNSDKSKNHTVAKDSIKLNEKFSLVKQNSTDLKKSKIISSVSSKLSKDQKVNVESERRIVSSKLTNTKPVLKIIDDKISRIKKPTETPVKRTSEYFKRDKRITEKPKKVSPTNVTINSPVHKISEKYINYDSESLSSTSNTIFGDLLYNDNNESISNHNESEVHKTKKHQRFRTRTLESHEVKVAGNPENSEINTIAMKSLISGVTNVAKPLIKTPKAFYIPLEEKCAPTDVIENRNTENSVDSENNSSISYDDDFESYESDFEVCSSTESMGADSRDDTNSGNSEIESDNASENSVSKIDIKIIQIKEDDKHLDSGNYELRETYSKTNSIRDDIIDNTNVLIHDYLKSADSARHVSYTDEGFDENSGGFSSTSILSRPEEQPVQGNVFDIGVHFFDKSVKYHKEKIINDGKKLRVRELLSLISLDTVKYSLFDMSPIPYDIYMKTFGKSNSTQGSSQTNDDSIDEAIQTNFTDMNNKWTQYPVDFSENEIQVMDDNRNDSITDNYLNTIDIICNPHKQHMKYYDQIKFVKLSCPLQIYCKQRLGCSIDLSYSKDEIDKKIILANKNLFLKTVRFMRSTGNLMINYLNEKCHSLDTNQTQKSEFPFSKRFTTLLPHTFNKDYLKDRPPAILSFSETSVNCFLTVHPEKDFTSDFLNTKDMETLFSMRTLICIWTSQNYIATTPVKILLAVEKICSCGFDGDLTGMVISGSKNGVLYAWDLNESDNGQMLISKAIEDDLRMDDKSNLKLSNNDLDNTLDKKRSKVDEILMRSCTYSNANLSTINTNTLWMGAIVDIIFLKSLMPKNTDFEKTLKYNNQVSTLHQCGFLTIWTIINSAVFKPANVASIDNYYSNLLLHKSHVIDLRTSFSLNNLQHSSNNISDSFANSTRIREFDLITAQRRNSLKKGDITMVYENKDNLKNGMTRKMQPMKFNSEKTKYTIFGQEIKSDNKNFQPKKKLESNLYDTISTKYTVVDSDNTPKSCWDGNMVCLKVKHLLDKRGVGHFLVACNGGNIVHHFQKSLQKKSFLFSCGDNAVTTTSIEICPYKIPYFLVGCHDSTIHLYSLDSSRPIKNFISTNSIEKFTYASNLKYATKKEARITDEIKSLGNDIISVQWSKSKPCRFFAISRNGRFIEWDLTSSDVTHKQSGCAHSESKSLIQELKILPMFDGESGQKKEYMILQFQSGEIQVHSMEDEYNSTLQNYHQERKLLMKYLELF